MSLVSDSSARLHLFVPTTESGKGIIQYKSWQTDSWTDSVDILATPKALPAFLDSEPVWDGGRRLYLLQGDGQTHFSDLGESQSAASWLSGPPYAEGLTLGTHGVGHDGILHVAYIASGQQGATVWFRSLIDGEFTPPNAIAHLGSGRTGDWPRVALDSRGWLHVVWTELTAPTGWPPTGVYYARSDDKGATWSSPTELSAGAFDLVNVAVSPDDVVHVTWLGAAGEGGRYHRYSADAGQTWSPTVTVAEGGATSGFPRMAFDSSGGLHLVYVTDVTTYYTSWSPSGWSDPEPLRLSDQAVAERGGGNVGGEWSQLAITGGNRLHVLFKAAGGIWGTSRSLPLEEVLPQATPEALPVAPFDAPITDALGAWSDTSRPQATLATRVTAPPELSETDFGPVSNSLSPAAIVGGALAAVVLVTFVSRRRP